MTRPPIHPGEILSDEVAEVGIAPAELARQLALPAEHVGRIIERKIGLDGDTALRLAHWFGNSPQFWLNLQNAYDIRIAEEAAGAEIAALPTMSAEGGHPTAA